MKPHPSTNDIVPTDVVPFGRNGAGLLTSHPVGLVIVIGLLAMGLFGLPGANWFFAGAPLAGGVLGLLLWVHHR